MDKTTCVRGFNTLFFAFIDDVISIFPEYKDLVVAKKSFETIKSLSVSAILKAWYYYVYTPYKEEIQNRDISFFIDKDYKNDLSQFSNSGDIMETINKFRKPIREMSEESKKYSMDYIEKLSKLSDIYFSK